MGYRGVHRVGLALVIGLVLGSFVACESGGTSGAGDGVDGGPDEGTGGGGDLTVLCTSTGTTCSCNRKPSTSKNTTPCFADKRAGSESPNVCCAKNISGSDEPLDGYECACTPPQASTWRCYRSGDGACNCTAGIDENGWPEMPASECVSKIGNCAYQPNDDTCACVDSDNFILNGTGVPDCTKPMAGRNPKTCPKDYRRIDACDGDCHTETCFGGAGEKCNAYGCTPLTWMCVSGTCQKI